MKINIKEKQNIEKYLDERFAIALETDKRFHPLGSPDFAPNNPDFIYYKGCISMLEYMGFEWIRTDGQHKIFN